MIATRARSLGRSFTDPVLDAQQAFRALLAAMAEPGGVHELVATFEAPAGLSPAATATLLTLADQDTPVWLDPAFGRGVGDYIRFHCGAPLAERQGEARIAVVRGSSGAPLSVFDGGDERYPDRSATVIIECAALAGGEAVTLTGPGIRDTCVVAPSGVGAEFWSEVAASNARYPLGIDLVLTAGNTVLCLPRSCRIACSLGGR